MVGWMVALSCATNLPDTIKNHRAAILSATVEQFYSTCLLEDSTPVFPFFLDLDFLAPVTPLPS